MNKIFKLILTLKIMQFAIDDLVVYNPNIDPLPLPDDRPHDHGIVLGISNNYIMMQFTNSYKTKILKKSISFLPRTQKFYKNILISQVLCQMMKYIKIKTMRPIFEEKTNTTSFLGPFSLIEAYL